MYTNADMTLYHWNGTGYDRKEIKKVFWSDSHISNIGKTGQTDADKVFISIPESSAVLLNVTTGKDLVVKGICQLEFDNTDQKMQSESLKLLKAECEVFNVNAFDPKLYGSEAMRHYELSCK